MLNRLTGSRIYKGTYFDLFTVVHGHQNKMVSIFWLSSESCLSNSFDSALYVTLLYILYGSFPTPLLYIMEMVYRVEALLIHN